MKPTKSSQKAFTLIELLVVIAIIALLLAILTPSLAKAKEYAYKVICTNNIRSQATAIRLYAEQNKGLVPRNENGNWFQDLTFWCTNEITRLSGVDYKSFYCPVNKLRKSDDARFWQYSFLMNNLGRYPAGTNPSAGPVTLFDESKLTVAEQRGNYRVMAYNYMFDRINTTVNPNVSKYNSTLLTGEKAVWITKLTSLANCGSTVMIMDNIISANNTFPYNFAEVTGGLANWGIFDSTNHLARQNELGTSRKDAAGGNCAYADGHIVWKDRKEIKCRYRLPNAPYTWW